MLTHLNYKNFDVVVVGAGAANYGANFSNTGSLL
jgi:protein involved in ribonucleotide reduction